jgi:hypothetical protein
VSGEKEARLLQAWGDGRYGWKATDSTGSAAVARDDYVSTKQAHNSRALAMHPDASKQKTIDASTLMAPVHVSENQSGDVSLYLADIEGMSDARFSSYLEQVRRSRNSFKSTLQESAVAKEEHITTPQATATVSLFEYRNSSKHNQSAGPTFLARQSITATSQQGANDIAPQPHELSGLAYSDGSHVDRQLHPLLSVPGRVLNRVNASEARWERVEDVARAIVVKARLGSRHKDDVSEERVVGLAGLTARMSRGRAEGLHTMDPTGIDPESKSISNFKVIDATLLSPPRVVASPSAHQQSALALNDQSIRYVNPLTSGFGGLGSQQPLEEFSFEVRVQATGQADLARTTENLGDQLIGQKGWVGAEKQRQSDMMEIAQRLSSNAATSRSSEQPRFSSKEHRRRDVANNESQRASLDAITQLLDQIGASKQATHGSYGKRGYHTSAACRNREDRDLPTANLEPGEAKGSTSVEGPGIGGKPAEEKDSEDTVAKGEWRQLEDNVAGESRFGVDLDKKQKE